MAKKKKKSLKKKKIELVMKEYGEGKLKSGRSKKKVKSRKQAIAIALSEADKAVKRGTIKKRKKK